MAAISNLKFILTHPLNNGGKLKALARFLRWQIGSRAIGGAVLHDWVNGARLIVRKGETGLTGNVYCGLHEFQDMAYLLHVLREDDLFVDVGANAGSYTILGCASAGASGLAFEPIPSTYDRLDDNVRINGLMARTRCLNMGVGAKEGELLFTGDQNTANHVISNEHSTESAIKSKVTTLDAALGDEPTSLIKIDAEGYETQILEGASATLKTKELHTVIMELQGGSERYGRSETEKIELLLENGFLPYSYRPFDRTLASLNAKNLRSGNGLFIRDSEKVSNLLASARSFSILGQEI